MGKRANIGFGTALILGTGVLLMTATALPALALSLSQTTGAAKNGSAERRPAEAEAAPTADKPGFAELIEAMKENRNERLMLVYAEKSADRDVDLDLFVRMIDFRYKVLSTVGDAFHAASTPEEIEQASTMADAVLSVPPDPVVEDVFAELEESGVFDAACGADGKLPGGADCVKMDAPEKAADPSAPVDDGPAVQQEQPKSFWVKPWEVRLHLPGFLMNHRANR
jgi:hypothetical protein